MNTPSALPKEYVAPNEYLYGSLFMIFGSLPMLMGALDKNMIVLFVGVIMVLVSIILIVIGSIKKKKLLKQLAEKQAA